MATIEPACNAGDVKRQRSWIKLAYEREAACFSKEKAKKGPVLPCYMGAIRHLIGYTSGARLPDDTIAIGEW